MKTPAPIFQSPSNFSQLFAQLSLGKTKSFGDMAVVPLLARAAAITPAVDFLEDGIAHGTTQVTEVSDAGVVARVRIEHKGERLLLLIDGEQLIGAKQNRIVNSSFVIAPGTPVEVPVSCVERNRWHHRSSQFEASGNTLNATARSEKLKRVSASLREGRAYDADQHAVWSDVDGYLDRTKTASETAAYEDAYRARQKETERRMQRLTPLLGQVGIAAVRDGHVIALDVFNAPALYARAWKKIVRGLLAEEYATKATTRRAASVVKKTLGVLAAAPASSMPAPGGGTTLHGAVDGITFTAIEYSAQVFHATATAA